MDLFIYLFLVVFMGLQFLFHYAYFSVFWGASVSVLLSLLITIQSSLLSEEHELEEKSRL